MSVRKIAAQAGVSISTVSRVLNNEGSVNSNTRQRVLEIANRSGYMPAVGRRVRTQIGFCYTQEMTISHPFDSAVLEGIVNATDECGFDVVIINLQRDKRPNETLTQCFIRKGVRGVLLRTMAETRSVCQQVAREGFPHVVISERFDDELVNYIDGDSYSDSLRAVEYLISLGHRRIAFAMHNIPDRDHLDRLEGYKDALARHDLVFDPQHVYRQPFTLNGGATAMELLARCQPRPTAIYLADPMLGVGAVKKAHEIGLRIPDELSVVGFDDSDVRFSTYPSLTAVCQDARSLGFDASLWLTRMLTGIQTGGLQKTMQTYFEVQGSTGPVPAET